ncbi:hypothetical protein MTE01_20060 [Microbacterium testaceum]|uniref:Nitrate ABC transporter substrate-binding protein n=1 Tax=Microbacterium testaceum TaxID=2033 RepID=A0A4Y3QLT3_MICTE|nr:hypothetical protein [Microbacterium testaceum]GEB46061.1 hypothetical protein MTE01_20060 [Microbacterium testaceum]
MKRARTPLLITTGLLAALVLAGCTSTPDAAPSVAASATATDLPAPDTDTSATPTTAPIDPTCENIIPKSTVDDFKSLGWTSQEEPFRIGATALDDGIQCKWGDAKVASDRVQIFGWAPIDDATAQQAEKDLVASGWKLERDATGDYVTENPDWLGGRGADGYGLTYLFGDGWVKFADTRQSLLLVETPQ